MFDVQFYSHATTPRIFEMHSNSKAENVYIDVIINKITQQDKILDVKNPDLIS
jgi:hypothetical protein